MFQEIEKKRKSLKKLIDQWRKSKEDEICDEICEEIKNGGEFWLNIQLMRELKKLKSMEVEEAIENLPPIFMECYNLKGEVKKMTDKKVFCRTCSRDTSLKNLGTHR